MLCDEKNLTLAVFESAFEAKRSSTCDSIKVDDDCFISDDCETVKCTMKFDDKKIKFKLKVFVFIHFEDFFISCVVVLLI